MLGLPKATEMSKQLPKKAIYAKFQMNTAAKEKIDADISRITIVNEIAPNKVNIPAGDEVKNFFVLLVSLKRKEFDEKNDCNAVKAYSSEHSVCVGVWQRKQTCDLSHKNNADRLETNRGTKNRASRLKS